MQRWYGAAARRRQCQRGGSEMTWTAWEALFGRKAGGRPRSGRAGPRRFCISLLPRENPDKRASPDRIKPCALIAPKPCAVHAKYMNRLLLMVKWLASKPLEIVRRARTTTGERRRVHSPEDGIFKLGRVRRREPRRLVRGGLVAATRGKDGPVREVKRCPRNML